MREVTKEIMEKILNQLVLHNDYNSEDTKIVGAVLETLSEKQVEYLEVSFDSEIDWTYKLFYELTEPEVYLKRIVVNIDDEESDE